MLWSNRCKMDPEEVELHNDYRYRNYAAVIEKALRNFESSSEWADLISSLGKLNKVRGRRRWPWLFVCLWFSRFQAFVSSLLSIDCVSVLNFVWRFCFVVRVPLLVSQLFLSSHHLLKAIKVTPFCSFACQMWTLESVCSCTVISPEKKKKLTKISFFIYVCVFGFYWIPPPVLPEWAGLKSLCGKKMHWAGC